jgi:hypothetical protein
VKWLLFGILFGLLALLTWMLTVIGSDVAWDSTLLGWSVSLFLLPFARVFSS